MTRKHQEVVEKALRDPRFYAEYMDEELVAEFNAKREKRIHGEDIPDLESEATQ